MLYGVVIRTFLDRRLMIDHAGDSGEHHRRLARLAGGPQRGLGRRRRHRDQRRRRHHRHHQWQNGTLYSATLIIIRLSRLILLQAVPVLIETLDYLDVDLTGEI